MAQRESKRERTIETKKDRKRVYICIAFVPEILSTFCTFSLREIWCGVGEGWAKTLKEVLYCNRLQVLQQENAMSFPQKLTKIFGPDLKLGKMATGEANVDEHASWVLVSSIVVIGAAFMALLHAFL